MSHPQFLPWQFQELQVPVPLLARTLSIRNRLPTQTKVPQLSAHESAVQQESFAQQSTAQE